MYYLISFEKIIEALYTVKMFSTYETPNFENLSALIESESTDKAKRNSLKHYKSMLTKDGVARVDHDSDGFGRYISSIKKGSKRTKTTGATFSKDIRAALFGGKYDDLDIVNASGTIMYQLFSKMSHEVPCMEKYHNNRERVLTKIMNHYDPPLIEKLQNLWSSKYSLVEMVDHH
jgi:hypothetical protein